MYFCRIGIKNLAVIAQFVLFSSLVFSAERVLLAPDFGKIRLTDQVLFVADSAGTYDIHQVLGLTDSKWGKSSASGFKKPFDGLGYWLKIPVRCEKSEVFFFQSRYVILERFELFVHDKKRDSVIRCGDLGLKRIINEDEILHSTLVFRLKLEKDTDYDFYIYLNKKFTTPALPFYFRDSTNFAKHLSASDREKGIIYGIFIFLIFQGLVLWLYFRERLYLDYMTYVFLSFLLLFISDGTFRLYFPSFAFDAIHFSMYFIIPTCFAFVFLIVFRLLNTKALYPKLVRLSWFVIFLSYLFSMSNALGYFFISSYPLCVYKTTTLVLLFYPILFVWICLKTYVNHKSNQALVLLGLFSLTLIFVVLFAFLPFLTYQHELFMEFKWIILFEGIALMLIINRDLYLSKRAKNQLLLDVVKQRELAAQKYLQGLLDERKRMAEELHDNLSAKLSAMKIQLSGYDFSDASKKRQALQDLDDLNRDVRNISHAISPILLKSKGLKKMLEEFILKIEDSDLNLTVDYQLDLNDAIIPSPHEEILYFTVLELINNVIKHAQSNYLKLELIENEMNYTITVEDNGTGYNPTLVKSGLGIASIEQRAAFLNGSFHVQALAPGTRSVFVIQKS